MRARAARRAGARAALALLLSGARAVAAETAPAVLLPTVTPAGDAPGAVGVRVPGPSDPELLDVAGRLDALLTDTAQDLGLGIDLSPRAELDVRRLADSDLVARARATGAWVISPRVELDGSEVLLRLVAAPPDSSTLRVRVERVTAAELPVRAVIMLRDVVARGAPRRADAEPPPRRLARHVRSEGRAVLAVNAAAMGGFVGYSIQRSSGSEDARLLYPLVALGATVGVGAAYLVAEEWDIGTAEAWYLSAAGLWPTLAGHLIFAGTVASDGTPPHPEERWTYGYAGGFAGLTLATFALATRDVRDGGAVLAHSGGALGTAVGALGELFARSGEREAEGEPFGHTPPYAGMGFGAAIGWLAGSGLALVTRADAGRVLAVDLGAGLGALTGAAAASPLLLNPTGAGSDRGFVAATAGGMALGGVIAWFASRPRGGASSGPGAPGEHLGPLRRASPFAGVLGESGIGARRAPVLGVGLRAPL